MKSRPIDGLRGDDVTLPRRVVQMFLASVLGLLASTASGNVVINEIMYHPPNDLEELQYIELLNTGAADVNLSGWSFSKGVKFSFPPGTRIAGGGFLVICRNRAKFSEKYGAAVPIAGEFEGHLSHNGERVELSDRDRLVIDLVKYGDSLPWPTAADGRSSSLERICPGAASDSSNNWAASNLPELLIPGGTPGKVNDTFSANLPPVVTETSLSPANPAPGQPVTVSASVSDPDGVKEVMLFYRVAAANQISDVASVPMKRVSGDKTNGRYEAVLPAQKEDQLVRYRIHAADEAGAVRIAPHVNELRPTWSYSTYVNKNRSKIPFGFLLHLGSGSNPPSPARNVYFRPSGSRPERSRGNDAFIYQPPGSDEVQVFDFVDAPPRKGGFKVHFCKDQTLRGMTTVNVIFEGVPRYTLSEPLSYEVYRMAGVPAELTEHIRVWIDGRPQGYHLLVEQPNKAFLTRNKRNTDGNLYKLLWYGNGVIGKHEKKTNVTTGHEDLVSLINSLQTLKGTDQWAFIQKHFNVEQFASYFAASMCIQNWDGYHNNYFTYHDTGDTGRWEIYPWDEDKTWGDYDGASRQFNWYEMPITYAMDGAQPPDHLRARGASNGGFVEWWRAPGFFSGPMLANPEFRQVFLTRLREVCDTVFTEKKIGPLIDELEKRLEEEVAIRAAIHGGSAEVELAEFRRNIQSFRNQLVNRRKFMLSELDKPRTAPANPPKQPDRRTIRIQSR